MFEALKAARAQILPCRPPFWANTGHLQTILGHLLPSPVLFESGQELIIPLEHETECIHSTYLKGSISVAVYLFHGLGGSADASYMQRTAMVARSFGYHVFINNHRGCGKGLGLASEPYHSGRAEDLSRVIEFGKKMLPNYYHVAIGFSLSANALLLLSAGVRASVLPDASIAVNGPIHLDHASVKLTQGLNRIYDKRFVLELRNYIKENRPADLNKLEGVKTLRDFDEAFTSVVGFFRSRSDYYETCSAKKYLKDIQIPTVLITAEDDPFVGIEDHKDAAISASTILHIEKHGGHMGYLCQNGYGFSRWLDTALYQYLHVLGENIL